jgi:hypothetical protein
MYTLYKSQKRTFTRTYKRTFNRNAVAKKLTKDQPITLLEIVKYANQNSGYCPTAKELSRILNIHERAASYRIKRLVSNQPDCFIQEGRAKRINYDKLCNEPETAQFLLLIYKNLDELGRILKERLIGLRRELKTKFIREDRNDEKYIELICNAGYMHTVSADASYLRFGSKFKQHLEYLKLLSKEISI